VASAAAPQLAAAAVSLPALLLHDEREAWRQLAAAWQVELPATGEPCAGLRSATRLQCFRGTLPWPQIRLLDRPGWLALRGADGQPAQALLVAMDDRQATLWRDGQRQVVPLETLTRDWSGEFATFWRPPEGYELAVGAGQRGPTVDALAQGLARWAGLPAPATGAVLEGALLARLQAFQRAQGLPADGLAGPASFMQLNRVTGVAEPRLGAAPASAPATAR
jgi:general secretion pathway protein A